MALSLNGCTLAFSNNVQYQSTAVLELQLTSVTHKIIHIFEQKLTKLVTILPELTRAAPKYVEKAVAGDYPKPNLTSPMPF